MKNFNDVSLRGLVKQARRSGSIRPPRPAPSMVLQGTSMDLNRTLDVMAQKDLRGFYDFAQNVGTKVQSAFDSFAPSAPEVTRAQQTAMAQGLLSAKKLTLKSVAKAGAKAIAQRAPAIAKSKAVATAKKNLLQKGLSAFDSVFSGASTFVSNAQVVMQSTGKSLAPLYGAGTKIAAAFGVKLPSAFQGQVAELDSKMSKVKSDSYVAQSYVNQVLNPLLNARTVEADALAKSMGAAISDVQNACAVALTKLSIAKVAASSAQNDIMRGVPQVQSIAAFGLQYKPAEQAFNEARLKMQLLDGLVSKARALTGTQQKGFIARTTEVVQGGAQALYDTGAEAGGQLLKTAESVGVGVTETGGMMKFLPYILIGGAALYIVASVRQSSPSVIVSK